MKYRNFLMLLIKADRKARVTYPNGDGIPVLTHRIP